MAKTRREKLPDHTPYLAATYYEGEQLPGLWDIGLKIDGVRYIRNAEGVPCSRQGTPALPEVAALMPLDMNDAELFRHDWGTSIGLKHGKHGVNSEDFYSLVPLDSRLVLYEQVPTTPEFIQQLLDYVLGLGHEGLVLRQGTIWSKVVPIRYADIMITGYYEGNGRLKGTFGGFTTKYGRVGGGFSDEMRNQIWAVLKTNPSQLIGKLIQVAFREKTSAGKLRMPVFDRFRFDKQQEQEYGVHDDRD